jgi:hypothetical protein
VTFKTLSNNKFMSIIARRRFKQWRPFDLRISSAFDFKQKLPLPMMKMLWSLHAARDNKTLDGVDAATVLEQSHYWLHYAALFGAFSVSISERRWLRDARAEKDINLLQIHYISLHILTKSSNELSLIEACCRCSFPPTATTKPK